MIIYLLSLINIIRNIKINFIPDNLLKFMKNFIEEKKLKDFFNNIKEQFLDFIKDISEVELYKNNLKYINFDKFSISLLFVKYKSGFVFKIKADGLTNIIYDIIEGKYELNLEKDNE